MLIKKNTKYLTHQQFFELFEKLILDTSKGKRTNKVGKKIKTSTLQTYIYTQKLLVEFADKTNFEIKVYIANNLTAKETDKAKKYYKKFYTSFTDFLYKEKDLYDNYVSVIIKSIRVFFNYLYTERNIYVGDFHKSFYILNEQIPIVVLTPDQLNYLIYDVELNKTLPEHLVKVKDIFIFGCTVALRFSDLMKLKKGNVTFYNNAYYLKVTSLKTEIDTTIKLPSYAVDILHKYHNQHKTLLPPHSNAWLNKCFKTLGVYFKFTEPMIKYRTKRGLKHVVYKNKEKKQHYTLGDHITTHTMRRTAITTMLRLGMHDEVVRKISGHAANSKEFYRYVDFAQDYVDEQTDKMFEKLTSLEAKKSVFSM